MPTIVVGGHSRNVGKTSVTAGVINAFREYPWTAIKISSHRHSNIQIPGLAKEQCDCEIYEETDRDGSSDTSRFLAAGAARSFWMQIKGDPPEAAMQQLLPMIHSSPYTVIESNRILRLIRPDLCIMVLRYDVLEFKDSARDALRRANAVVVINPDSSLPPWEGVSDILSGIPQFVTLNPQIIPAGLIDFVRTRVMLSEVR